MVVENFKFPARHHLIYLGMMFGLLVNTACKKDELTSTRALFQGKWEIIGSEANSIPTGILLPMTGVFEFPENKSWGWSLGSYQINEEASEELEYWVIDDY